MLGPVTHASQGAFSIVQILMCPQANPQWCGIPRLASRYNFASLFGPGHVCTSGCADSNKSFLINAFGTLKVGVLGSSGTTRSTVGDL